MKKKKEIMSASTRSTRRQKQKRKEKEKERMNGLLELVSVFFILGYCRNMADCGRGPALSADIKI